MPITCRAFSAALHRNRIKHTFEEHDGDHNDQAPIRIVTKLLPFFSTVHPRLLHLHSLGNFRGAALSVKEH
jgi:hypothetical protein